MNMNETAPGPQRPTGIPTAGYLARQRSSLGWRIAARIGFIFLIFGVAQFFVVRQIARRQFQALERTNLLDRTRQAFQSFEHEAAFLRTLTTATAAWRDTYDFAASPTKGYLERNFGGEWPELYDIDFVLMVGLDGRRIWSSDGHPTFKVRPPEAFLGERFPANSPYLFPGGETPGPSSVFVGMVGSPDSAWIYCAHAITNDDLSAQPRGMLLFGRRIDKPTLDSYQSGEGDALSFVPMNEGPPRLDAGDRLSARGYPSLRAEWTAVRREGQHLVSYTPLGDLAGHPMAALRLSIPRGIEQAGDRMVWFTSFTLLAAALITLGAILLAVRATVIQPIARLASYFTSGGEGGEEILRASARRTDEIGVLAGQAGALIERIREQNMELENQANTDRLTGLANRRFFDTHISKELRRLLRHLRGNAHGGLMAVAVIDVDHFKLYNDTYGHMAGDACLRALAETIQGCIFRPGDLACRFGGEEFILVLPETDEAGALVVAESVRAAVAGMVLPHGASPVAEFVTVSVGAAAEHVGEGFRIEHLIELADRALYAAKQQGRNRVVGNAMLGRS